MAESRGTLPVGVDRLRERIERWRQQRFKHGPMPAELWKSAVEMARAHGIYPVARALSIDYGSLKKRLDAAGDVARPGGGGTGRFVEVAPSALTDLFPPAGSVIEVWAGGGERLSIRLGAGERVDVTALVRAFRGMGS